MVTEGQVLGIMRYLAAAYPRREIDSQTVAVYVMQLLRSHLPADVMLLAAMNLIDTSEWLPTVAELTAEAKRIEGAREGWYLSANYRLHDHPLPAELFLPRLPSELSGAVLGYEMNWLEAEHGQD